MEKDISRQLSKAMKLCSISEKSAYDIEKKLKDWQVDEENIPKIIFLLKEQSFIDDRRFAGSVARDKTFLNKWGKMKTGYYLRMKKIDDAFIREALNEIDQDEYLEMMHKELMKKASSLKKHPPLKQKSALVSFGQSRGYEFDLILELVDKIL